MSVAGTGPGVPVTALRTRRTRTLGTSPTETTVGRMESRSIVADGMENACEVAWSVAKTIPPCLWMAVAPVAPSWPPPVITTAMADGPAASARVVNNRSAEGPGGRESARDNQRNPQLRRDERVHRRWRDEHPSSHQGVAFLGCLHGKSAGASQDLGQHAGLPW